MMKNWSGFVFILKSPFVLSDSNLHLFLQGSCLVSWAGRSYLAGSVLNSRESLRTNLCMSTPGTLTRCGEFVAVLSRYSRVVICEAAKLRWASEAVGSW